MLKVNSLLGYEKGKKQIQVEKLKNDLLSVYYAEGKRYDTQINFLIDYVLKSYIVREYKYNKYIQRRSTGNYEPVEKTEYQLYSEVENSYFEITKTLYNFGMYLINNDLLKDIENIIINDNKEIEAIEEAERLKVEEEERQLREAEKNRIVFENWLKDQVLNFDIEGNRNRIDILINVFSKIENYPIYRIIEFIILVDNYNNIQCRNKLIDRLSYFNTCSLKAFECLTSIKLGRTDKEIKETLNNITKEDFRGIKEYKETIRKEIEKVKFYISKNKEYELREGEEYNNKELKIFIHKEDNKYIATEGQTGFILIAKETKGELKEYLKEFLKDNNKLNRVRNEINKLINNGYIAPAV